MAWPYLRVAAALCCAAAATAAHAQLSLGGAVDFALANSSSVRVAQADRAHAAAALAEVKDVYIPSLSLGSGLAYTNGFPIGDPSVAKAQAQSLLLSFSQKDNIRAAHAALDAADLNVAEQRRLVVLDTALTYCELAITEDAVRALQQQELDGRTLIAQMQQRQQSGVESTLAVKKAELRSAQARLRRINMSARAAELREHLADLTGIVIGHLPMDLASLPAFPVVADEDAPAMAETAVKTSFAVKQAEKIQAQEFFEARAGQRVNWRPEVDFVGQYGYFSGINNYSQYYRPGSFKPSNAAIGVQITLPLYNKVNSDRAKELEADNVKALAQVEGVKNQVRETTLTAERAVNQTDAAQDVARLQHEIADADAEALATQARQGSTQPDAPAISPQQVTEARLAAGAYESDYLTARFEHIKAELNLLKQSGGLEAWVRGVPTSTPQP